MLAKSLVAIGLVLNSTFLVKKGLEFGLNNNLDLGKFGVYVLQMAAIKNDSALFDLALKAGADMLQMTYDGSYFHNNLVTKLDSKIVEIILSKLNPKSEETYELLPKLIAHLNAQQLKSLIAGGLDLNKFDLNVLHDSVVYLNNLEMMVVLKDLGANKYTISPFLWAILNNDKSTFDKIAEHYDINDGYQSSIAMIVSYARFDIGAYMMEKGMKVTKYILGDDKPSTIHENLAIILYYMNDKNLNILSKNIKKIFPDAKPLDISSDMKCNFLSKFLDSLNKCYYTPAGVAGLLKGKVLMKLAVETGDLKIVELLLEKNPKPWTKELKNYQKCVDLATKLGYFEIANKIAEKIAQMKLIKKPIKEGQNNLLDSEDDSDFDCELDDSIDLSELTPQLQDYLTNTNADFL